jgi:hypothetical protein
MRTSSRFLFKVARQCAQVLFPFEHILTGAMARVQCFRVDSRLVAMSLRIDHKAFLETLRKYQTDKDLTSSL